MPLMHEASNPNLYSPVRATKATTQPQGIIGTRSIKPLTVAPTAAKSQPLLTSERP